MRKGFNWNEVEAWLAWPYHWMHWEQWSSVPPEEVLQEVVEKEGPEVAAYDSGFGFVYHGMVYGWDSLEEEFLVQPLWKNWRTDEELQWTEYGRRVHHLH